MALQTLLARTIRFVPLAAILALGVLLSNPLEASLPRGVSGDRAADRIFGKPDFSEINPYTTVAGKLWLPHGVVIDRTNPAQNRMYVYDAGNNRILGLDLNTCRSSLTDPLGCTADIVIGQPNMSTSACNGDSGFQNYPVRAPASASSLCGLQESQLSISEGGSGASMAVDGAGNLYVTDFWNNRVLKYNDPFGTDSVADDVWGQANFVGNDCNRGMATPDATSLCFTWGSSNNWTTGVDLDGDGNLWVVDSGNNRVLRFPPGSKTADLVLGQSGFTSAAYGTALNQLWDPSAVRVSPTTGWLYVSESRNNRVLVYKPPFVNGMAGSLFGSGFWAPQGIDFDPMEPGSVWIMNLNHTTIELWDESTRTKTREVGWRDNGNVIGHGSGSVGIDSAGNLYVAIGEGEHDNDVLAFDRGAPATLPTKQLFGMARGGNLPTASGLGSGEGVVISDGQLIVADQNRLLFWNDPASALNGQPADGYAAGATGFADFRYACCGIMTADKNHHLFVTGYLSGAIPVRVDVYQLPLTLGASPIQTLRFPFNVMGGGQVTSSNIYWNFTGIAVSDAGELWLSHSGTNRVFRLRNPLTAPLVDVILGQLSPSGTAPNRGGSAVANSLKLPGHVSFDRRGNLFVSDHSLEAQGNFRLLEFPKNLIPSGNATVIYAPAAAKIFTSTSTWQPAFDSHNHMIVGYNPYGPGPNPLGGWFPGVYGDPLSGTTTPDAYLLDYHSMAYSAVFDENDNLYITDLDRSRVLFYDKPTAFLPAITDFAPLNGSPGTSVVISGTKLTGVTAVRFNGISAAFTPDSDTQVTAIVPAGAMTGPISVTTPTGGAGSLTDFGVGAAPTIASFSPVSGAVGVSVTINGTNFTGATSVTFNGISASFSVNTAIKITATVPAAATTGPIGVTTPNGPATSVGNFTVAPRITGFAPGSGDVGASVIISGANFTGATSVKFNGTAAVSPHVDSSTQITATVPANATSGPISVTTPAGTGTSAASFTVAPRITSFSPTIGVIGTSVTINGANFTSATSVTFGGVPAIFTVNTALKITATVPAGATTGTISVTTPSGAATSATSFTVNLSPMITNFTPSFGAVGASVTINGGNFTGITSVKFNGTSAAVTVNSPVKITASVPANATTGKITVTNPAGTATSTSDFTVAPRITSLTPTSGVIGTIVTINGANFTGATSVKFNGLSVVYTVVTAIKITATVPSGTVTGKVSVTTPAGTGTSAGNFTIKPAITTFGPVSGAVSVVVTINGTGFTGASSVKFNGTVAAFTLNSDVKITATVPANATTGPISVTTAGGTATSTGIFTVAPRITSFTPTSGAVGATVTITGANFTGATAVTFNGVPATTFVVNSATKITVTVPAGATPGKIAVTTPAGTGISSTNFNVL